MVAEHEVAGLRIITSQSETVVLSQKWVRMKRVTLGQG